MAAKIGDLVVSVGADITGLRDGLARGAREVSGFADTAGKAGRAAAAFGAAIAAAGVAAGAALSAIAATAMETAAEIERLAKVSNATPDVFQQWASAARTVGIEQEKLADILKDVNDRVGDFMSTGGGPMADFFERIAPKVGVTAQQFARLSGPEALQLYVSSLEKAGVNQKQMTFYMEAMASDATMLLPLLRGNGAEMQRLGQRARELGTVLDRDTLGSLLAARDSFRDIGLMLEAVGTRIVAELAPALELGAARLQAMTAAGGPMTDAIARTAAAFGDLLERLTDPAFVSAAASIGVGLFDAVGALADSLVILKNNAEIAALAVGALGVAVAALGGPWTIAARLIGVAGAALYAMKGASDVAAQGAYDVAAGEATLRRELEVFATSASPAARSESIKRVVGLRDQATAALVAAEAELALAQALGEGQDVQPGSLMDMAVAEDESGSRSFEGRIARIKELQVHLADLKAMIADLKVSEGGSGGAAPTALPTPEANDLPAVPGLGSGASVASQMSERLEALRTGLQTEQEALAEWYETSRLTLDEALASERITRAEHAELTERLEQEHQDRLRKIREMGGQAGLVATLGAADTILSAMGAFNDKAFKMAKVAGAAQALISTWQGSAEALKLPFPKNLAAAAAVMAKGLGFVAAIKSVNSSGGGGGSRGASAGAGASAPGAGGAAQTSVQTLNFTITNDPFGFGERIVRQMASQLNEAQRNGSNIRATVG